MALCRMLVCTTERHGWWIRKNGIYWSTDLMTLLYIQLYGIIQTWLTLAIYNTLSLHQPLQMCSTPLAEQAAKHARAFILVFASYWWMLFALQRALSRWHTALRPLYTDTCRWRSHIGWQRAWSRFPPLRQYNGNINSSQTKATE
jgi:hypothetical protein